MNFNEFIHNHHTKRIVKEFFGIIVAGVIVMYSNEPYFILISPLITRARSMFARYYGMEE